MPTYLGKQCTTSQYAWRSFAVKASINRSLKALYFNSYCRTDICGTNLTLLDKKFGWNCSKKNSYSKAIYLIRVSPP